jgi:hypothetical protein
MRGKDPRITARRGVDVQMKADMFLLKRRKKGKLSSGGNWKLDSFLSLLKPDLLCSNEDKR